jgi:AmmeMemoRadiSam system protein B/AmmeMemoRadiSam system protein A
MELTRVLSEVFKQAKPRGTGEVAAVLCPHAGYVFSAQVAASGYNQVDPDKKFDNVFVIASSHQVSFPGASVYNRGDYITPLGKAGVNTDLANELIRNSPVFRHHPEADRTEHSLEVQLPFLQFHLKNKFNLVPIVLGTQSERDCKDIAKALKPWFNGRNLFVFSTDFAHYPDYDNAVQADKATCDAIVAGSPKGLLDELEQFRQMKIPNLSTNLCGWTSVLVMLYLAEGDPSLTISPVHYMNSGDSRYGDRDQVVGYWSMVVTRRPAKLINQTNFDFTHAEKASLLRIARNTIEKYLTDRRIPAVDSTDVSSNLKMQAGAFVTLKENGNLRGCIGRFSAGMPLYRLIGEMAVASATEDSRFEPVKAHETDRLEIEISVLSPLKKINSPDEIILGKHGVYMKKGHSTGTFLPQVATETGWTVEEFLGHCARDKAGIGWNGWKEAELFIYEACVFAETGLSGSKD